MAIADPDRSLSFSEQEVSIIQAHFPTDCVKRLQGREANRTAIREQLAQYPVLHFSTHGRAGWTEPLEGGLQLADKQYLSVAEILDLRLDRARLAVLSACETGIPGTDLPDEMIGLPSALLQAGVAGVVASLWSVNDLSTAMLIERFYRFWRDDRLEPSLALRRAQQWLRDTTNGEKLAYFRDHVPQWAGSGTADLTPTDFYINQLLGDPAARSFESPFWWAAFSLTGV